MPVNIFVISHHKLIKQNEMQEMRKMKSEFSGVKSVKFCSENIKIAQKLGF